MALYQWQGQKDLVSPAASGAAPRWGAPSTDRGGSRDRRSRVPPARTRPSARGFGVDVEERKRERGRGGVARFLLQDENVRCWFGAFRFSRSKTRIESPLEISLRMSSLKSYICMYTEE